MKNFETLQVDNIYKNNRGQQITITNSDNPLFPFRGSDGNLYSEDGTVYHVHAKEDNLIELIENEPTIKKIMLNTTYLNEKNGRVRIIDVHHDFRKAHYLGDDGKYYNIDGTAESKQSSNLIKQIDEEESIHVQIPNIEMVRIYQKIKDISDLIEQILPETPNDWGVLGDVKDKLVLLRSFITTFPPSEK